jgi:glutaminyl-peptide cyclotransferase
MSSSAVYQLTDDYDYTGVDIGASDASQNEHIVDDTEDSTHFAANRHRNKSFLKIPVWIILVAVVAVFVTAVAVIFASRGKGSGRSVDSGSTNATSSGSGSFSPLSPVDPNASPPEHGVKVVQATTHDPDAFLQGLEYSSQRGVFFESTGLTGGKSSLRRVDVATGKVIKVVKLPEQDLFGEGLTLHGNDLLYMLTWKAERGFVFKQDTLELVREWKYPGEGWGLASDTRAGIIYMSDGTTQLRVLDATTLAETRRINVTFAGKSLVDLNELEYVCGEVWANVWRTNKIYRIDPGTGVVRSVVIVEGLPREEDLVAGKPLDVLNGIAFDAASNRLWISGKLWPKVYEVTLDDDGSFSKQCIRTSRIAKVVVPPSL